MIYGFYFKFLKYTHNRELSIFLARFARFLFIIRFQITRLFIKKRLICVNEEQARGYLENLCPDPKIRPDYDRIPLNPEIDLSIIVPVYNYVEMIEENIRSILNQQTQYRYELILIDDGSTDGSRAIVEKYAANPCVKAIRQENKGIAGARNTGIANASGKYLMFVDCDDTIRSDMVEQMMSEAYRKSCDIVMCAHDLVKMRGDRETERTTNCYPNRNLLGLKNNDLIMNYAGLPWGKVYRRELFMNVRFFSGYWYEDTIVHFLLFTQCRKFSYLQKSEYDYRWYGGNFSHVQGDSSKIRSIEYYWLILAILENYDSMGLPKDGKLYTVLLRHLSAYCYPVIAELDEKTKEAVFVLSCGLLRKYRPEEKITLPYMLRVTEQSMLKENYELWKLASLNQ